jgi:hypothetical protein
MEKKIEFNGIEGDMNAKKLFVVTTIDEDDAEDTVSRMWLANDEDHLHDLVKSYYVGDEDEDEDEDDEDSEYDYMRESVGEQFENDWGFTILYTEVGNVK